MTNNQHRDFQPNDNRDMEQSTTETENEGFEVSNQAQNLGGGKGREGGQKIGQFGDDDFTKTDQTITQAAPGQTATSTNQGSSNA